MGLKAGDMDGEVDDDDVTEPNDGVVTEGPSTTTLGALLSLACLPVLAVGVWITWPMRFEEGDSAPRRRSRRGA